MRTNWCDHCRGEAEQGQDLLKCSSKDCHKRYHLECAGLRCRPESEWSCHECSQEDGGGSRGGQQLKARVRAVKRAHAGIKARAVTFFADNRQHLAPFVAKEKLATLTAPARPAWKDLSIDGTEPYVHATLRSYQVAGVNWMLAQYGLGTGGILGDEMGLGKTIQTLAFLSALKAAGLPGPHLVVTPLAVLQNWANEMKRFTPGLSFVKVHGGQSERDRLLSDPAVLGATFDVYLTTYDTLRAEEAFFTESFLFHTVTIDEGHRLKNENSSLSAALSRISCPFRLLLTGTPIQNSMHELSALLHYILPEVIDACMFDLTCDRETGVVDQRAVANARGLLESLMIRRVKAEVEKALLPKKEYVLRVPLSALQRAWYQRVLTKASGATELVSASQLSAKIMQLQKICNHPKAVVLQFDRDRAVARRTAARAAGSEHIKVRGTELGAEAMGMEAELRALGGSSLAAASGKLAVLDRLLVRKKIAGSRVLLFSQYTLALDVLEEFCARQYGRAGYLRLDGATNRIDREMDVRSFNAAGSLVFIYLISTRAGGQGINLATADTVVLYGTCWNPQVDLQAEDRAHRIGQNKQVKVYRLISESTMEERILATARQKLFIDKLVIKDAGAIGRAVDGAPHRAAPGDPDQGGDDEQSVSELWATLCHGASALLDPAKNGRTLTAEDYDAILDGAVERAEDDAAIARAEEAGAAAVGEADGAAMAGAAAKAVHAASTAASTAAEVKSPASSLGRLPRYAVNYDPSRYAVNYDLKGYGEHRLLLIGTNGLQQLCQDRGIWSPVMGPGQAAAALLLWKSDRAETVAATVDLTEEQPDGGNFTAQDRAAWSKKERQMHNFQKQMHGPADASAFMRSYFLKNQGKPLPPAKPPRSGYSIFRSERFAAIGCNANGSKGEGSSKKNWSKQVGAEWSALEEEAQAPFVAEHLRLDEEHAAAHAVFEVELGSSEPYASPAKAAGLDPVESYTGLGVEELRMVFPAEQNPDVPDRMLLEALRSAHGDPDVAFGRVCTLKEVPSTRRRLQHAGVAADAWVCAGDGHAKRVFEAVQAADGDAALAAVALGAAQATHMSSINGMDRKGRKGRGAGAKRYAPPPEALEKKAGKQARKLRHDDDCFCCDDGGELLQCDVCPRVYHMECIGLTSEPKGMWHCPWHLCWTCRRKSSSAGGKLFHCMTCPETFCFDCVPDQYIQKSDRKALALASSLESRGCRSIKNFLFFRCDDCVKDGKKQHSADVSAHIKKQHASGVDGIAKTISERAAPFTSPLAGASDQWHIHWSDAEACGQCCGCTAQRGWCTHDGAPRAPGAAAAEAGVDEQGLHKLLDADYASVAPAATAPLRGNGLDKIGLKRPHESAFEAPRRNEEEDGHDSALNALIMGAQEDTEDAESDDTDLDGDFCSGRT